MNRRAFLQTLAASSLAAAAPAASTAQQPQPQTSGQAFQLSVMLWTVFRDLPFEQRLEKVASAGYRNVELVGEYRNWSPAQFAAANAARQRLGISFDATAGLGHGFADPAARERPACRTPPVACRHGDPRMPGHDRPLRQRRPGALP